MIEEFAFIKVVYNHLRNELSLDTDTAVKIYKTLIGPKFFDDMSPFILLLAVRAFDLIIIERKPSIVQTFPQLIEGIEKLSDKLSVRQLCQLFMALPVKSLLIIGGIAITTFGAGITTGKVSNAFTWPASRPERLKIISTQDGNRPNDSVLGSLTATLLSTHHARAGAMLKTLLVETEAPGSSTSKYSAELSIQNTPILDGYAFSVTDADNGSQRLVLPVRSSGGVSRVFVPASDGRARIQFLLLVEVPVPVDLGVLANGLLVRVLE